MIQTFDNFLSDPQALRESALRSGFGSWRPKTGDMGASFYEGVNFWGDHATAFKALHEKVGQIIPSSMFFRITNPSMERALIHSDREYGDNTAIVYLSGGTHASGTGFFRHVETGFTEMPDLQELMGNPPLFEMLKRDTFRQDAWDMYEFVEAKFNRCVVFDAPKIHCRIPPHGFGSTDADSRMVWVAHFNEVGRA